VIPSMSRVSGRDLFENSAAQYRGSWDIEVIWGVLDRGQVSLRLFPTPQELPGRLGCPFCLFQVEFFPQAAVSTQSNSLQTCGCSLHISRIFLPSCASPGSPGSRSRRCKCMNLAAPWRYSEEAPETLYGPQTGYYRSGRQWK
jgi:hypothetical protein